MKTYTVSRTKSAYSSLAGCQQLSWQRNLMQLKNQVIDGKEQLQAEKYPGNIQQTNEEKKQTTSEFHMILKDTHLRRYKMDGPVMKTTAV